MDRKDFGARVYFVFEDRNLKPPSDQWKTALWTKCKDMQDETLNCGFEKIMRMTQEDWNKKYGFGGRPALADWMNFFGRKSQTPEQIAKNEIAQVLAKVSGYYCGDTKFLTNKITREAILKYTHKFSLEKALYNINWRCFDNANPNIEQLKWVEKELINIWLDIYQNNPELVKEIEEYKNKLIK